MSSRLWRGPGCRRAARSASGTAVAGRSSRATRRLAGATRQLADGASFFKCEPTLTAEVTQPIRGQYLSAGPAQAACGGLRAEPRCDGAAELDGVLGAIAEAQRSAPSASAAFPRGGACECWWWHRRWRQLQPATVVRSRNGLFHGEPKAHESSTTSWTAGPANSDHMGSRHQADDTPASKTQRVPHSANMHRTRRTKARRTR